MRCFSADAVAPQPRVSADAVPPQSRAANKALDVFLGGMCGTTTWRKDAMPLLDSLGKTYYNPQVDAWHEGLMAEERRQKETCRILLFVIGALRRTPRGHSRLSSLSVGGISNPV